MTVIVFCGPSLSPAEAAQLFPHSRALPPASCGDIYRASMDKKVRAIGLIDGYFDHRLSVWHKEILWALHRGIHVYGSASMGALRAAELEPFGMIGVGEIFEKFRAGALEDDDEVAVVHDEAERGYALRSDAMVNLRATLASAVANGVIGEHAALELTRALKRLFYPDRNRHSLTSLAKSLLGESEATHLLSWLETCGVVDQKRLDAAAMLERIATDMESKWARPGVSAPKTNRFEYTNAWHALEHTLEREVTEDQQTSLASANVDLGQAPEPSNGRDIDPTQLLERIQAVAPDEYFPVLIDALERAFSLVLGDSEGASVDARTAQLESERFRHDRGLLTPEQTAAWLAQHQMSVPQFSALIYENALCARFAESVRQAALKQIPSVVQNRGLRL